MLDELDRLARDMRGGRDVPSNFNEAFSAYMREQREVLRAEMTRIRYVPTPTVVSNESVPSVPPPQPPDYVVPCVPIRLDEMLGYTLLPPSQREYLKNIECKYKQRKEATRLISLYARQMEMRTIPDMEDPIGGWGEDDGIQG
jgi:hypothetical protein